MDGLIHIQQTYIGAESVNSVNIKDLVEAIDVKTHASQWFQRQVDKYGFVEDEDYLILKSEKQTPSGLKHILDYIVTLDTAKELAMVANTPKGRETRKYFISVEKQSVKPMTQIEIVAQTAVALAEQEKKLITIQSDVEEVKTYIDEDIKTRPVSYQQQKALQDAKMTSVYAIGGSDEDLVKKLHSRIWSIFKKKFHLPRYAALPASKFEEGLEFIRDLTIADMV